MGTARAVEAPGSARIREMPIGNILAAGAARVGVSSGRCVCAEGAVGIGTVAERRIAAADTVGVGVSAASDVACPGCCRAGAGGGGGTVPVALPRQINPAAAGFGMRIAASASALDVARSPARVLPPINALRITPTRLREF
jgi:hypothetical protein